MTDLAFDIHVIDICTGCAVWHANADDTGFCLCEGPHCTSDSCEAIRTAPGIDEGYDVHVTGDETWFSSHRCDACRRPFGGDRVKAVMMSRQRCVQR